MPPMRGGVSRGGPARGGGTRGGSAGRGVPPNQPGRGGAGTRGRAPATGPQRMPPPPPRPPAESYEDYVRFEFCLCGVVNRNADSRMIHGMSVSLLLLPSLTTKATRSPGTKPTTAITVKLRGEFSSGRRSLALQNDSAQTELFN